MEIINRLKLSLTVSIKNSSFNRPLENQIIVLQCGNTFENELNNKKNRIDICSAYIYFYYYNISITANI